MSKALNGIRILDMTHVQAGPTSSQLLGFMGADVIKLESPFGDATRKQLRDVPDADSLYFTMLNCNKRSITVNLKNERREGGLHPAWCRSATCSWRTSGPGFWTGSASDGSACARSTRAW